MTDGADTKLKRVSSAAANLSALVDDITKHARKSFKESGSPELDAKLLKESVSALRELLELLGENSDGAGDSGIVVKMEGAAAEWGK